MCTFNGERFLAAQLESFARQTRHPDELVVCDDGSSDRSCEIVREFGLRSPFHLRLVVNDRNLGTTKNFEQAMRLCRHPLIALADQDDVWCAHKLDRIEKAILASPSAVGVFSDADIIDEHSLPLGQRLWRTIGFTRSEQNEFAEHGGLRVLIKHPVITGATLAFRRQLLNFLTPIPAGEVHDMWISFLMAACGTVVLIPEPLIQYRQHQSQQIGPGPVTSRQLIAQARNRGPYFYLAEVKRFQRLYERLRDCNFDLPDRIRVLNQVARKIRHLEHRAGLPPNRLARIPGVIRETLNGDYTRYSGGWRSIAKDLTFTYGGGNPSPNF